MQQGGQAHLLPVETFLLSELLCQCLILDVIEHECGIGYKSVPLLLQEIAAARQMTRPYRQANSEWSTFVSRISAFTPCSSEGDLKLNKTMNRIYYRQNARMDDRLQMNIVSAMTAWTQCSTVS